MKISLIISTYNWTSALKACLISACNQKYKDYEIIVADDGSTNETKNTIKEVEHLSKKKIIHVWHEDKGFRLAMIRNRAVSKANGDYLIFIDGDCLLPPYFLSDHAWLAKKGYFVAGSRIQLKEAITNSFLKHPFEIPTINRKLIFKLWLQGNIRRIHPIIKLPLHFIRYSRSYRWQGAVGCNIAVWKHDYYSVNGFDNSFSSWGLEDSEFVMRLIHNGVLRKDGKLCSFVLHLYHQKGSSAISPHNQKIFNTTLKNKKTYTKTGVREIIDSKND